jgi:predicted membrane protein
MQIILLSIPFMLLAIAIAVVPILIAMRMESSRSSHWELDRAAGVPTQATTNRLAIEHDIAVPTPAMSHRDAWKGELVSVK